MTDTPKDKEPTPGEAIFGCLFLIAIVIGLVYGVRWFMGIPIIDNSSTADSGTSACASQLYSAYRKIDDTFSFNDARRLLKGKGWDYEEHPPSDESVMSIYCGVNFIDANGHAHSPRCYFAFNSSSKKIFKKDWYGDDLSDWEHELYRNNVRKEK